MLLSPRQHLIDFEEIRHEKQVFQASPKQKISSVDEQGWGKCLGSWQGRKLGGSPLRVDIQASSKWMDSMDRHHGKTN